MIKKVNNDRSKMKKSEKLKPTQSYRFSVRDLVIIAILCSLGGVMSTYVKYIANIINIGFGVPFGAAQIVAGLHVLWLILCYGLVRKFGTGTLAGFLKGVIELFTGNPHGITVVLISGIEGIFVDLGMAAFRKKHAIYSYGISAGLAAASEVFVFYPLFLPSMPVWFIIATSLLAFGSGVVFGGFFGTGTLELVHMSKVVKIPNWHPKLIGLDSLHQQKMPQIPNSDPIEPNVPNESNEPNELKVPKENILLKMHRRPLYIASLVFIVFFIVGGVAFYLTIPNLLDDSLTCRVEGDVNEPYDYDPKDFKNKQVTIKTDLSGSYTIEGEKEYTGVPLNLIVNHSDPKNAISKIKVIGSDGYTIEFDWENVRNDNEIILIEENEKLRLIAGDYDLSYSVKLVDRIVIR
jgi:energy-coupling factor transport system substrate-specific component